LKKAIITGGLGFIGSHLVSLLLKNNVECFIVDNKSSNVVEKIDGCEVLVSNVEYCFGHLPDDADVIFHLASFVGPSGILKYSGEMGNTIVNDTYRLGNFCVKHKMMLVDISTSEVYGHKSLLDESSEKIYPGEYQVRTEYAAGKMLGEIITVNKAKVSDLKYQIIRPFNVAGKRQQPNGGFVLPRFVISALTNQPITIFGDGQQERAFTDVNDVCNAILEVIKYKESSTWNIGNPGNRTTINELANRVVKHVKKRYPNKSFEFMHVDPKTIHGELFSEAVDKIPYTAKMEGILNWYPKVPVDKTISDVIDYYEDRIEKGYEFNII